MSGGMHLCLGLEVQPLKPHSFVRPLPDPPEAIGSREGMSAEDIQAHNDAAFKQFNEKVMLLKSMSGVSILRILKGSRPL